MWLKRPINKLGASSLSEAPGSAALGVIGSIRQIVVVLMLALTCPSFAAELRVPSEFEFIQDAVDAARDGDVIVLSSGTYTGDGNRNIDFRGKAITVRSQDPLDPAIVEATVLDCGGSVTDPQRAFVFCTRESRQSHIAGLTIKNGFGAIELLPVYTWDFPVRLGGAILCREASPTISHCQISNCSADFGGAIACWEDANPLIDGCVLNDNSASEEGGGVFGYNSSPVIQSCVVSGNERGGVAFSGGNPTVSKCVVAGNEAVAGGAVWSDMSSVTLRECDFHANSADKGGAVYSVGSSTTATNCLVYNNDSQSGGGILSVANELSVNQSVLVGNRSSGPISHCMWIPNPSGYVFSPSEITLGYWREKFWALGWGRLLFIDELGQQVGGLTPVDHIIKQAYLTEHGAFLYTRVGGIGHILKSPDGVQNFEVKVGGIPSNLALHRSLVSCGATDTYPEGVVLFFEYAVSPAIHCSTNGGEDWSVLFQCASESIRHFHGGVFAPGVGDKEGRLLVMTGDQHSASSILFCDDLDDLIENPQQWRHRWGLDVENQHVLDPMYTLNNNLDSNGVSTSQSFRSVDILVADDGYAYWGEDTLRWAGQNVFRANMSTLEVERVGTTSIMGEVWSVFETSQGQVLVASNAHDPATSIGCDDRLHLYLVESDPLELVEVGAWRRTDFAEPSDSRVTPTYWCEVDGNLLLGFNSGFVGFGKRSIVGQLQLLASGNGGAASVVDGTASIFRCTMAGNSGENGGGYYGYNTSATISQSILWGDFASSNGPELSIDGSSSVSIEYSDIMGGSGLAHVVPTANLAMGIGNIDEDPRFVEVIDSNGVVAKGLHLQSDSPCRDTGDPLSDVREEDYDIDGEKLIDNGGADIGADEYHDCDDSGIADYVEVGSGTSLDCNGNSVPDICDLMNGSSFDIDSDDVPDECQTDCNGNSLPDVWDILSGSSEDCNSNSIADECEVVKEESFVLASTVFSPIGHDSPQAFEVLSAPEASSDVVLMFRAQADLGAAEERIAVKIDGTFVGYVFEYTGRNCPTSADYDAVVVSAEVFNSALDDGSATVRVIPSKYVVAGECALPSTISVTVAYTGFVSVECYENGIPDECDIAYGTVEDCNTNGIPDVCDIGNSVSDDCNSNAVPDECDIQGGHDCCVTHAYAGCSNAAIRNCVCGYAPECCEQQWSQYCVDKVGILGCYDCYADNDCNENGILDECDDGVGGGDYDADGDRDRDDYHVLMECFGGPGMKTRPHSSSCEALCVEAFDFDGDHDVDLLDLSEFQLVFTKPCGDVNNDGVVDHDDLMWMPTCLAGPGGSLGVECGLLDCDSDGDVDLLDFAAFQRLYSTE